MNATVPQQLRHSAAADFSREKTTNKRWVLVNSRFPPSIKLPMSEYSFVEKPFLDQLAALGWTVIDQGPGIPTDPAKSVRTDCVVELPGYLEVAGRMDV